METPGEEEPSSHDTIPHTVPHPPSSHDTIPHTVPHPPSSHDTIPHTVPHPPDGIASPTNSAEDFTQPPVDLSQASDHNTPRGTVQHHDYHHSTVPTQLAQPMDVEAPFPQVMMEASVAGAMAPGYTINSNRAPVQIHKQSKCQTNIAETINSSNTFQIDQVHNYNQVHNEQHVHQPRITYNISHTYITGDQEIPFQAATGVTEHGALSNEDDEVVDNIVTTDSFRRALGILTTGERLLLLSAHPGLTRQSFLSALRRQYRKKGYTVYDLSCVSDWDKKGPVERGSLVIFDCAFGDVRLDREQYHGFYQHSLYSINSMTTKLVFVVYPHILLELVRYDRVSVRTLLSSMEVVELEQDHTLSTQPYADLFLRMLYDKKHGQMIGALLGLTMKGQSRFLANPAEVVSQLKSLGFPKFSATQLEEYCSLFKGSLLATSDSMLINRVLYDAAGLALGRSYLETVLLQVCDVKFLVQHVRTQHTVTEPSVILISQPDNGRLMIQRMVEELGRGKLPEMVQHPCLHSPEFLQELEAFCGEDQLQLVLDTNDSEHSLSLLYWSVWGLTPYLTEWCLRKMTEQHRDRDSDRDRDNRESQHMLHAAFVAAVIGKALKTEAIGALVWFRDELAQMPRSVSTEKLHLPLPPVRQRHTEELNTVCDNISKIIKQVPLCQLGAPVTQTAKQLDLVDDVIYLSLPQKLAYLSFRLLTDQQADEQDREGNTLLHLAAEAGHLEAIKMAVSSGASLRVKNEAGETPPQLAKQRLDQKKDSRVYPEECSAVYACKIGDMTAIKELLCYSTAVDDEDEDGVTLLHTVAAYGHTDIVSLLADLNANFNATDKFEFTPLHYACYGQYLETGRLLVERGSLVNVRGHGGVTPLNIACGNGDKNIAKLLITHNASIDAKTPDGWTPLHHACHKGHTDIAQLLLKSPWADINMATNKGYTSLHFGCRQGNTDIVRLLVTNGADVNVATFDENETPLHWACRNRHNDIVQLLVSHGAYINVQREGGLTVLHDAIERGYTDIVRVLLGYKLSVSVSDGVDKGPASTQCIGPEQVNINMKDNAGHTALHMACAAGKPEAVSLLLQQDDIDVNALANDNFFPLLCACNFGSTDILQLLLLHNADVNMSFSEGMTCLHLACMLGYHDAVHLLLQHGSDVNMSDSLGKTPLMYACGYNHFDIVHLLLQHGGHL